MTDRHPAPCPISAAVAADIQRRARVGWHKYGVTVGGSPLPTRAWVQHAYEEALDLAVYLRRLREDLERCVILTPAQWDALRRMLPPDAETVGKGEMTADEWLRLRTALLRPMGDQP